MTNTKTEFCLVTHGFESICEDYLIDWIEDENFGSQNVDLLEKFKELEQSRTCYYFTLPGTLPTVVDRFWEVLNKIATSSGVTFIFVEKQDYDNIIAKRHKSIAEDEEELVFGTFLRYKDVNEGSEVKKESKNIDNSFSLVL